MRWHEFLFGVIVLFINKATSSRVTDLFKAVKCFITGIAVHGSHAGITVYVVFVIVAIELNNEFFATEVTDMFHSFLSPLKKSLKLLCLEKCKLKYKAQR